MRPGRTIAYRFELLAKAGSGGMATVFRARDKTTGEIVAVKVQQSADVAVERFEREASVLANLSHPAIVRYIARGTTADDEAYLVMEWVEHETLATRLVAGLTVAESVALARRVATALGVAHDAGVVHRDVKPENLLLPDGEIARVKVADFGIARPMTALEALTKTGMTVGTPGYMAPEQARGDTSIDGRADVFGLGCVLYECLTGRQAFAGQSPVATMVKILHADPAELATACPEAPRALVELVTRMLDKARDRRPATMHEVASTLDALTAHAPLPTTVRHPAAVAGTADVTRVRGPSCVVLIGAGPGAPPDGNQLAAIAARHDARVDALADGSFVAVIHVRAALPERVRRAARLALDIQAVIAGALLSITCADPDAPAADDAVDVAATLLGRVTFDALRSPGAERGIFVDAATAGYLEAGFQIERHRHGAIVRAETKS